MIQLFDLIELIGISYEINLARGPLQANLIRAEDLGRKIEKYYAHVDDWAKKMELKCVTHRDPFNIMSLYEQPDKTKFDVGRTLPRKQ